MTAVLADIDRSLRAAVAERDRCTGRWARCPTPENFRAAVRAQTELNLKLEQRFAAQ